jgi:AcrR family transcriptional regulator
MMSLTAASNDNLDTAKRQQILDGARQCFLAQGFDGASMNDIVRASSVSKGTIYSYFPSKEKLFEALIYQDRRRQAEQVIVIEGADRPLDQVLYDLGLRMVSLFTADESLSYVRTVIAISGKFPEIGRSFYEAGPAYAIAKIAMFFKSKMDEGLLQKGDPELAAMQFIELVQCGSVKPRLFASVPASGSRNAEDMVRAGVTLFLKGLSV